MNNIKKGLTKVKPFFHYLFFIKSGFEIKAVLFSFKWSLTIPNASPKRWKCTTSLSLKNFRGVKTSGSSVKSIRYSYVERAFCSAAYS